MRIVIPKNPPPPLYEVATEFLWLPIWIDGDFRWLEKASYVYSRGRISIIHRWDNKLTPKEEEANRLDREGWFDRR